MRMIFGILLRTPTMPALNIYVTEELKRRMSNVDANWSEICRQAIEIELLRQENQGLPPFKVNDVKDWATEMLEPFNQHKNVVIKPYLHMEGKKNQEVKVLSHFYEETISELSNYYIHTLKGKFGDLISGKHLVDLLFPGREWLSGTIQMKLQLLFNLPKKETISEDIM